MCTLSDGPYLKLSVVPAPGAGALWWLSAQQHMVATHPTSADCYADLSLQRCLTVQWRVFRAIQMPGRAALRGQRRCLHVLLWVEGRVVAVQIAIALSARLLDRVPTYRKSYGAGV